MEDVQAAISFKAADYDLAAEHLRRTVVTADGRGATGEVGQKIEEPLTLPAGAVLAWELQAAE
jgi:hypothetical protein